MYKRQAADRSGGPAFQLLARPILASTDVKRENASMGLQVDELAISNDQKNRSNGYQKANESGTSLV